MRKLLIAFLLCSSLGFAQTQIQAPSNKTYVFNATPGSGFPSASLLINIQVTGGGNNIINWCGPGGVCPDTSVGNNAAFNPYFLASWAGLSVTFNNSSASSGNNTITCTTTKLCTAGTPLSGGTLTACATHCLMNVPLNFYNNTITNLLTSPFVAGATVNANWGTIERSGVLSLTNGSATIAFVAIDQTENNANTADTYTCDGTAWAGKTLKVWDSGAAQAIVRTVTLGSAPNACTTLSVVYPGTTATAPGSFFWGLYDWAAVDALVTQYAINSKKISIQSRPATSAPYNGITPQYIDSSAYQLSQKECTQASDGATCSVLTAFTANVTINSQYVVFSGGNWINRSGSITFAGTGSGTFNIDHCFPSGTNVYTTTTCLLTAIYTPASAVAADYIWTPPQCATCYSSFMPGNTFLYGSAQVANGGTTVTWISGSKFNASWVNQTVNIGGTATTFTSVASPTSATVAAFPNGTCASPGSCNYSLTSNTGGVVQPSTTCASGDQFMSGNPVPYSPGYVAGLKAFAGALVNHFNGNTNISYGRLGTTATTENSPINQSVMQGAALGGGVKEPVWTRTLAVSTADIVWTNMVAQTPTFTLDAVCNQGNAPTSGADYVLSDLYCSQALLDGFGGIGSDAVNSLDPRNYAGIYTSGKWATWFDMIQTQTRNGNRAAGFMLQLQQAGASNAFSNVYSAGTGAVGATTIQPISIARTKNVTGTSTTTITYNLDPTVANTIYLPGNTTFSATQPLAVGNQAPYITVAGFDATFNGTFLISASSSVNKTVSYIQPNFPDVASSSVLGWTGNGVTGSWEVMLPFIQARGGNTIELYWDDALLTFGADPNDTYHNSLAASAYTNGQTLGAVWFKAFKDYAQNAVH